jgi:AAA15 family ATPase/GTPase
MQYIAIENFKSYESQVINNLNPQINIIIGKNGEGKSNFFKGNTSIMQPSVLHSPIKSA